MSKLPDKAREFFREKGREGGKKSSAALSPEQLKRRASKAAKARHSKRTKGGSK